MLKDIAAGQLTQTKAGAFEVGRNLATTPGKVVKQTPLYQLIQYTPTTDKVLKTPVVIFPPWINRFYILDLTPEKSFVKWCVDQGISLFMVSWKSADESIADAGLDDYVLRRPDRRDRHHPRRCSASRASTPSAIAWRGRRWRRRSLTSRRRARRRRSSRATFFTAQVDFAEAGDLKLFTRRRDHGAARPADQGEGLSRRPLHGRDLQPAARARPHLDLCRQQLPAGRRAGAVRPAALEQRHDQPAGAAGTATIWKRLYKGNKLAEKGGISVAGRRSTSSG